MNNIAYFMHESSYIDQNTKIGDRTRIEHFCHVQSGAIIGSNCFLGENVNISNNVKVGDGCIIQNNVSLYEGVVLENNVFCGASAVFTNDLTPRVEHPKGRENYKKTLLKTGASIGANATIVCGHTIGEWGSGNKRCFTVCPCDGCACPTSGMGLQMWNEISRWEM